VANRGLVTLGLAMVMATGGCVRDGALCRPPRTIAALCGLGQGYVACDCVATPIDFVAYVDLCNLPQTILVSSPGDYGNGNDMIGLVCLAGDAEVPPSAYSDDLEERLRAGPIRARLTDARIVKVMMPGNGVLIPTWHLEIASASQVRYYHVVDDSTEILIEPGP
jgi:hypothetical protein